MLTPTQDQYMGQLRQLLTALGVLATAFGYSPEKISFWTNLILQIAGPIMIGGSLLWSWIANSRKSVMASAAANLPDAAPTEKAAVVAAVADLPEVKTVELDKSKPTAMAINAVTPHNVQAT